VTDAHALAISVLRPMGGADAADPLVAAITRVEKAVRACPRQALTITDE